MEVLIAVLTYKREEQLRLCLDSIHAAVNYANASVGIVIGDNDPDSNEERTYIPVASRIHLGFKSVAAGRQTLLSKARTDGYRYLAFVDDDEQVSLAWLGQMLKTAETYMCSAVAGPVLPQGLEASDFALHSRVRHATGTVVESAGAGNLLLKLDAVRLTDFDVNWGLSGGEDTDFTLRVSHNEGPIVWCDEAEVYEPVTTDRLSRKWLVKRYFSNGRILYQAQRSVRRDSGRSRLPVRILAILLSTARLIVVPFSSTSFRYFLDNGARNLGFLYEAMRRS